MDGEDSAEDGVSSAGAKQPAPEPWSHGPEGDGEDGAEDGVSSAGAKQPAPGSEASWAPGRTQTVSQPQAVPCYYLFN